MPSVAEMFRHCSSFVSSILGGRSVWGLADQLLISATNFVTMALVIKALPDAAAFGIFSLVYSALLFANIIQSALVTQPHNVLATSREGDAYRSFTSALGVMQIALVVGLTLLCGGAAIGSAAIHASITPLLIALVPSIFAWQLQEFIRRVLYTEGRLGGAFLNDIISYGGQIVVTAVLFHLHRLTGPSAMYALAITSAAAIVLGVWQIRGSIGRQIDRAAITETWHFGKWLVGSEILSWCSSMYLYLYLLAMLVGAQATGILRASQLLYGPARVFSFFLQTILPIQFARTLAQGGESAMHKQILKGFGFVAILLGPYCLLMAIFPRMILTAVCKPEYAQYPRVLTLYSISAMLSYCTMVIMAALTARRQTRDVFMGNVYGSIVAAALAWPFIAKFGVSGAVLCMIVTALVVLSYYIYRYRNPKAAKEPRGFQILTMDTSLDAKEQACAS
jgi:O-antigen/teichoic acid export membrane protein